MRWSFFQNGAKWHLQKLQLYIVYLFNFFCTAKIAIFASASGKAIASLVLIKKSSYYSGMAELSDVRHEVHEEQDEELKEPDMYRVILHNDHYTTMDFVVEVLIRIFHKNAVEATKIMLDVHKKGKGFVGIFPYDIAVTKVAQVGRMAKEREFPLKCTLEKA